MAKKYKCRLFIEEIEALARIANVSLDIAETKYSYYSSSRLGLQNEPHAQSATYKVYTYYDTTINGNAMRGCCAGRANASKLRVVQLAWEFYINELSQPTN